MRRKRSWLVFDASPAGVEHSIWLSLIRDRLEIIRRLLSEDRSLWITIDDKYGGFAKCAYTFQKFQSDTERVLAQILERDSMRWLRPVQGQFNIYYRRPNGPTGEQPEYVPDFVAATSAANLLIETKKAMDIDSDEVRAKAKAAVEWCAHASDYSARHGGKPWRYLLIPHDAVVVNATLGALATRFTP